MDDSEKTELTPANDNLWYWLATLYGEQTGLNIDGELANKNRIAWNRWVSEAFSVKERVVLIQKGFDEDELAPFSDAEKKEHYDAVLKRSGYKQVTLPDLSSGIDFRSTLFEQNCCFSVYLFPADIFFASAIFCGPANFVSATFSGSANFSSARFRGFAFFDSATFSEGAYFWATTFSNFSSFAQARFCQNAFFDSAIFSQETLFLSVRFDLDANFINTKFSNVTAFSKAVFSNRVLRLFGATLHEATKWHGVKWPPPAPNRDDGIHKKNPAQEQVYAYERLKQEMEKLKKHEDEQFFFRKELRARRELVTWRSTYWWLNFLYEKLSNYGYGVVRPLVAFAALFLVGFALFALDPFGFAGKKLTVWDAAFTSLANMFGTLPLKTLAHYATDQEFAYVAKIFAIF